MSLAILVAKVLMFSSVVFVWVIRYPNIVKEFKEFNYPDWLRDIVGIIKLTAVVLILIPDPEAVKFGAIVIGSLMFAAMTTHIVFKNTLVRMYPSTFLCILSGFLLWSSISSDSF